MTSSPDEDALIEAITSARIEDAIALAARLNPDVLFDLIFDATDDQPAEEFLTFLMAYADHAESDYQKLCILDTARSLLVTSLSPLKDADRRALEINFRSCELTRELLISSLRDLEHFTHTPEMLLTKEQQARYRQYVAGLNSWVL
ncbi:hypothetical protein LWF01_08755 [Saxibacter everestensis]|uniref:Immunity protein 30 domain-containing protein n=1 Tax=Saxibacter everestensis TaxID=2909229 RepID=A0ABY8QXS3_9MICO|nr:hypothetical protein LWF01_08755 [Brevibacteriaceae bacterium ZFBP1038]